MRIPSVCAVVSLVFAGVLWAQQPVEITPKQVNFEIVQGGPLGAKRNITIRAQKKWSVKVQDGFSWLSVAPAQGAGQGTVVFALNSVAGQQQPGPQTARVTISTEDGATATVSATLNVVRRAPDPLFSYLAGPKGCTKPPGHPDASICAVPDERPPGNFSPPLPGGSYVDPNFGAKVRILTAPQSLHGYSSPSAISLDNKYALVGIEGYPTIVYLADGRVHSRPPVPLEGTMWDPKNEEIMYFLSGASVRTHDIRSKRTTTVIDYAKGMPTFTSIKTGARGDTSKDGWIAFFAPAESVICALDLNTVRTYCARYNLAHNGVTPNNDNGGAIITKGVDRATGKRYVILQSSPIVVYSVNVTEGRLDFEFVGPEVPDWGGNNDGTCDPGEHCMGGAHIDTLEDSSGTQWLLNALETTNPCEYSMNLFQLNKGARMTWPSELGGGRKRILSLYRCSSGDNWADWHAACAKHAPYCVVSTTYGNFGVQYDANTTTPIKRTPHLGEIFVIRGVGTEIRRLVHHRSIPLKGEEARSYWTTPRACISTDGSYVLADSNFGMVNGQRVILIETGFGSVSHRRDNGR